MPRMLRIRFYLPLLAVVYVAALLPLHGATVGANDEGARQLVWQHMPLTVPERAPNTRFVFGTRQPDRDTTSDEAAVEYLKQNKPNIVFPASSIKIVDIKAETWTPANYTTDAAPNAMSLEGFLLLTNSKEHLHELKSNAFAYSHAHARNEEFQKNYRTQLKLHPRLRDTMLHSLLYGTHLHFLRTVTFDMLKMGPSYISGGLFNERPHDDQMIGFFDVPKSSRKNDKDKFIVKVSNLLAVMRCKPYGGDLKDAYYMVAPQSMTQLYIPHPFSFSKKSVPQPTMVGDIELVGNIANNLLEELNLQSPSYQNDNSFIRATLDYIVLKCSQQAPMGEQLKGLADEMQYRNSNRPATMVSANPPSHDAAGVKRSRGAVRSNRRYRLDSNGQLIPPKHPRVAALRREVV